MSLDFVEWELLNDKMYWFLCDILGFYYDLKEIKKVVVVNSIGMVILYLVLDFKSFF